MQQTKLVVGALIAILVLLVVSNTFYTVDEREKAIIIQFGKVKRFEDQPGLHWKIPFLQRARYFDARILVLDADAQQYQTLEKKQVVVDSFVKWRVVDPLLFYVSVEGDGALAKSRIQKLVDGGLRDEFGKRNVHDVISGDRSEIMDILREHTDIKTRKEFGIEIVDVRVQRVDWPPKVSAKVYERMNSERKQVAEELRAKGREEAKKIRAKAEREREVILAEAYRKAEIIRGQGDAKAAAIYAKAYNKYPDFYALYRSLNAYRESFKSKNDIMIIDPSADFFKYFKDKSSR